jgi:hypothetical protein
MALENDSNFVVIYEQQGTFTADNLAEHYSNRVLKPYLLKKNLDKCLVFLDQASTYFSTSF